MKNRVSIVVIAIALILFPTTTLRLVAQVHSIRHHHYQIVDVGTFGGPSSWMANPAVVRLGLLNNQGTLTGEADTSEVDPFCAWAPGCYATHGFQWKNGTTTDLGVLPGGIGSQVNWISANGLTVGIADNGQEDPLSGGPQLHGVLWQGGTMTDLGALFGGYDTWALSVNSRGEIAGEAYNTIPDADSMFGYGYQSRAFYWNNGVAQDLGTLGATDRVRKQSARQISDFGSAAARQWQCLQPGFDIHGLHFGQTVGPPPGQNPFVEIDASRFAAKRAPVLPQPHAGP